ncbi:hypothetical protein N7478_009486 [Penicillium angulare]|uniref:uncharacterized protein n=1 Tax=Penicillium angulare TaxID=116970 RepID=UPI00253FD990|nr:uncharacterized protein N7478_009486 [Penicillium angulare]KAJ5266678.1 hypothetical protein N7478_009486 [Penicillium angulare]
MGGSSECEEGIRLDRSVSANRLKCSETKLNPDDQTPLLSTDWQGEGGGKGRNEEKGIEEEKGREREYKEEEFEVLSPGGCGKEKKKRERELRQEDGDRASCAVRS